MMLFPLLYGSLWYVLIYPGFWICEYPSFNVLSLACPKRLIVQGTISFWGKSSGTVCSAKRKKGGNSLLHSLEMFTNSWFVNLGNNLPYNLEMFTNRWFVNLGNVSKILNGSICVMLVSFWVTGGQGDCMGSIPHYKLHPPTHTCGYPWLPL